MEENKPFSNEEEVKQPNIGQELNNPSTDKSIVPAIETTSEVDEPQIEQSEIPITIGAPNYKPETEDMEVHHHTHASHGKKNWKSYFWEFLMLFLAVFCGFLAEYQLEHKIEKERGRKYMSDMVENLKYDTIRLNRNLQANKLKIAQLDSFRAEISKAIKGNINSNRLYDLWLKTQNFNQVVFNRASVTQLKNAGSFRLITNNALAQSIGDYYERIVSACESQEENTRVVSNRLDISSLHFFDYEPFDDLIKTEMQFGKPVPDSIIERNDKPLKSNSPLALLNTNSAEFKLLYNDAASKEKELQVYNSYIRWAKEAAENLMTEIEEEYHFKK